jgi:hypothetical protein
MTADPRRVQAGDPPRMITRAREAAARERHSLADALVELAGPEPRTVEELHAAAVEEWGSCTLDQVAAQLRALRGAGFVRPEVGGYVAVGGEW